MAVVLRLMDLRLAKGKRVTLIMDLGSRSSSVMQYPWSKDLPEIPET
jgi:hypothetical protein